MGNIRWCLIWNYTHQYQRHNQRWKWYLEHNIIHVSVGLLKSAYSRCYCLLSRTCYNTMELSLFLLETFCIGNWFIPWICGIWSRWALPCIAIMCSTLTFSLNFVLQYFFYMCHVKWLVMVNEFVFFIILNLAVDCQNVICIVELVNEVLLNDWDKAVYLQPLSSRLYLIIQR